MSVRERRPIELPFGLGKTNPVSTGDVSRVVTAVLAAPGPHLGRIFELTGPRSQDLHGVAREYSEALNREVTYADIPPEDWERNLKKVGVPDYLSRHLVTMADVNGILQIEMCRDRRQVVGIVIHVMSAAGLAGASVAASVMCDNAIPVIQEKHHLRVPVVRRKRPTVREYDWLTAAPVLVVNLGAVIRGDGAHFLLLSNRRMIERSRFGLLGILSPVCDDLTNVSARRSYSLTLTAKVSTTAMFCSNSGGTPCRSCK